jgi:UDP-N-acetylmuramoyl-tripeptide--D-alanyl-D-alanine ligase
MSFWTADRVADALSGLSAVNLPRPQITFGRVWTDTRTVEAGDLFVALVGERFDAHDFVKDAVSKGAAGVVIAKATAGRDLGVPVFEVRDTLVAWALSRRSTGGRGTGQSSESSARTARRARRS